VPRSRLEEKRQLERENLVAAQRPAIYVGAVASGDSVIKSAAHRNRIAEQENVMAFEMKGAGVWDEVPCIVVKGVCDYADCHKHKGWQNFAAAAAAAAAKAILERYTRTDTRNASTAQASSSDAGPSRRDGPSNHSILNGYGVQHTGSGNFSIGGSMSIS
jgi:hypothetical protein